MQKYITHRENLGLHSDAFPPNESGRVVYLASDVDARIAELTHLLEEAYYFAKEDFPDFPPSMLALSDVSAGERYLNFYQDLHNALMESK